MKSEEAQIKGPRLEKPLRITEQVWPEGTVPVVSVICITYNHENFIREAIEGFLMQETTFPVEIFIHDDASTDSTAEIVKEYAEKYPKLFWTQLQTENQWSKGAPNSYFFGLIQKQRGEFIALCEGDDYWISKKKLQKQVEMMENDSTATLCFHNTWVMHPSLSSKDFFLNHGNEQKSFYLNDIINKQWFISTSSILCCKKALEGGNTLNFSRSGDIVIQVLAACRGSIIFLDDVCSVYRRHAGGVAFAWHKNEKFSKEKMRPNHFWIYFFIWKVFLNKESSLEFSKCLERIVLEVTSYFADNLDASATLSIRDFQKKVIDCFESEKPKIDRMSFFDAICEKTFVNITRIVLEKKCRREILKNLWGKRLNIGIQISRNSWRSGILSFREITSLYLIFTKNFIKEKFSSEKHEKQGYSARSTAINSIEF